MEELLEDNPPSFAQSTATRTPGGSLNSSPQRRAAFHKINRVCGVRPPSSGDSLLTIKEKPQF